MIKKIILFLPLLLFTVLVQAQKKSLKAGLVINRSVQIKKKIYPLRASADLLQPAVIIEGNDITVDFNNAVLKGNKAEENPDEFTGVGILIKGGKNITVKNLTAKGYKVALMAVNVEKLTIQNCDFSYNYRKHLNSTQEKEDISDWMSYHQNENDEWLRYGAAIYLRNCDSFTVNDNKVTGGQNALMLTRCNNGMVYNNDFSFNSGIGIGMYRSSANTIAYNRINFNVRGYSHGVYHRGQDSAGILVYEQSNNNYFYKNSATHSGDGFFLWAGQTTMESAKGGCNDNIIARNDFSYAPTNGIEVTFSRNIIRNNRIFECDHGLWGGYSYDTEITGNHFRNNRIDIAIEHGRQNRITYNIFSGSKEAIRLWARASQPADWGYVKNTDTRSRNYSIAFNNFSKAGIVYHLNRTDKLNIFGNIYGEYDELYKADTTVTGLDTLLNDELAKKLSADYEEFAPAVPFPIDPFQKAAALAGKKNILITEWGPYDFRYPIIWNTNPADTSAIMEFDILGPPGKWKVKSATGVQNISAAEGTFPSKITAVKIPGERTDIKITLEYSGRAFTDAFGNTIKRGKPHGFYYKKFFQPISFTVNWFALDTAFHHPVRTGMLFPENARVRAVKTEKVQKLDYAWWGGIKADKQYEQFITVAEGDADIEPGQYEIGVTWDDAVRLYIDGKPVIDEWNPSLYKFDESPHKKIELQLGGKHHFRVEHVELGGFATLSLKMKKLF